MFEEDEDSLDSNSHTQLNKYKNETEERLFRDKSGKLFRGVLLTDRAVLARSKIILKEKVGEGSYSKVKAAYDLSRLRKIAVKIIDCSKAPNDFQEKFLPRELGIMQSIFVLFCVLIPNLAVYFRPLGSYDDILFGMYADLVYSGELVSKRANLVLPNRPETFLLNTENTLYQMQIYSTFFVNDYFLLFHKVHTKRLTITKSPLLLISLVY